MEQTLAKTVESNVYQGGCHCGRVRFQVKVQNPQALECNCSICHKKGFLHLIVPAHQFQLLQGADVLSTYRFNTHQAKHQFCRICGIHPFYSPRSHPDAIDVNIRALDGDRLGDFTYQSFDGQHWETAIKQLNDV